MGEREGERIARAKCGCRRPSRFSLNLHLFYFRVPSLFSSSAAGTTFFSQLLHCNLNTSLFLSVLYAGFWQSGVLLAAGAWVKMKKKNLIFRLFFLFSPLHFSFIVALYTRKRKEIAKRRKESTSSSPQ